MEVECKDSQTIGSNETKTETVGEHNKRKNAVEHTTIVKRQALEEKKDDVSPHSTKEAAFTPLVADGIPEIELHPSNVARLLKKNKSVAQYTWHKQAQHLRKKEDGANAIKLFKHYVGQGLVPGDDIVAMLFSTVEVAGDRIPLNEVVEVADFVRASKAAKNENALFCLLRIYCLQKTQQGLEIAMLILAEIKQKSKISVRNYTPIFSVLRHLGTFAHLDAAFALLAEVKASKYDTLECHFLDVLAMATQLRVESTERVYAMLLDFNEVIFRPSLPMLTVLEKWFLFQSDISNCVPPSRGVVSAEGVCSRCARMLQSIDLTESEYEQMLQQIDELLKKGPRKGGKGGGKKDRDAPFQAFTQWMQTNGPFDVVIDGANVGYFQWRPRDGEDILNYNQINRIFEYWKQKGKRVLVVLHERHLDPEKMARLPRYGFQGIIEKLNGENSLFLTPKGSNDDWYWLYAGLTGTRANSRMFMITNDQMRDHHFATQATRHFVKWRGRHMVQYGFERGDPTFRLPPVISFQSQRDQHEEFIFWHFPSAPLVTDPTNEPQSTASTISQALATTVSDVVEELGQVEWLCARNIR